MPDRPTCKDCRFWHDPHQDIAAAECRRYPPMLNEEGDSEWPATVDSDWCGEFERVNLTDQVSAGDWYRRRRALLDNKGKVS